MILLPKRHKQNVIPRNHWGHSAKQSTCDLLSVKVMKVKERLKPVPGWMKLN